MTIQNNGYNESFSAAPGDFSVTANGVAYYCSYGALAVVGNPPFVANNFDMVDVPNGGTYSGTLVFTIPASADISGLAYLGMYYEDGTVHNFNVVFTQAS